VLDLLPEEEVVFGEAGAEVFEEEWTAGVGVEEVEEGVGLEWGGGREERVGDGTRPERRARHHGRRVDGGDGGDGGWRERAEAEELARCCTATYVRGQAGGRVSHVEFTAIRSGGSSKWTDSDMTLLDG